MTRLHPLWERVVIVAFVATIAVPGLATLAAIDRPTSRNENRELAAFPPVPTDLPSLRAFPDAFTRYFEDNFSFRAHLVKWQAAFRFQQLRVSPSPTVIAGRDGWLFYADDGAVEDFSDARPFTDAELEAWRLTLEHTRDWLADRGIRYVFVIAPDKHVVYPELMPATLHRLHDDSRIDQLVQFLRQRSSVTVLDLRPALHAARGGDRLYHRTDTHWNDVGAWVGYEQIIDSLGISGMRPLPRSAFDERRVVTPGMDLAGMIGLKDVLTEDDLVLVPRQPRAARVIEPAHADASLMYDRVVTEQANRALPRAVVFRDSFASALIPFLSEHFSRAVYLWQNNFDPATIETEHPDVVIQEWVGRHLGNQWPYDAVADMRAQREPAKPITRTARARG
jgi:alginate O-acetyltransferase complex protein AlgJ